MNLEFVPSDYFATELKKLAKRYRGLADDYEAFLDSLKENPLQGTEIAPILRKFVVSKNTLKSGAKRPL